MADCKVTFLGAMSYFEGRQQGLFDLFTVPEGLDKDTIINDIVYRAGDFPLLYINPDYTRFSLGAFSAKWLDTWQKWYDALSEEYDPLENYNRHEEYEDKHTGTQTNALTGTDTTADNGSQIRSGQTQTIGTDTTTETGTNTIQTSGSVSKNGQVHETNDTSHYMFAYNENSDDTLPKPHSKDESEGGHNTTDTETTSGTTTETPNNTTTLNRNMRDNIQDQITTNQSGTKTLNESNQRTDNLKVNHTAHLYGNIGVTTSQQMLKEEIEVRKNNIYNMIADMVIQEFCIMIY